MVIPREGLKHLRSRGGWLFHTVLALLLSSSVVYATEVILKVEPEPPTAGESFRLIFEVQGELTAEPDFSPLEEQFEILGRNRQTSIQWINGNHTRTASFVLEVLAKQPGEIDVPALNFGSARSAAKRITPVESAAATPEDDGLLLEVDAIPRDPYVQEQVTYTIRLWRRYELSNASLSEPELSTDSMVKSLGEDRHFEAERNGKRYEVIERRYAIFPQVSGEATLEPVTVTAQVLQRASSLFEMFGRAVKTKRIRAEPIRLRVRPIPVSYPSTAVWLPARKVRLNETWEPGDLAVTAGDPITRSVTLWAEGLTSGQLPEMFPSQLDGLKIYPDQPQLSDQPQDGFVTAVRQEKAALIPTESGVLTVPALDIPWWNTETEALETARLPAQTITATAAVDVPQLSSDPPKQTAPPPVHPTTRPATELALPTPRAAWWAWDGWSSVALCALLGWGLTWRTRGKAPSQATREHLEDVEDEPPTLRTSRTRVEAACRDNDPSATHRALLAWARARWPTQTPLTLGALTRLVSPEFAHALNALERARFGRGADSWQGLEFAQLFSAEQKQLTKPTHEPAPALPVLFKLVR